MDRAGVQVVVEPELRPFLRRPGRAGAAPGEVLVPVPDGDAPSVGHVVQTAGVPLTEVGTLRLDGAPVSPVDRAPRHGRLEVVVRPRPQEAPTSPPRFLLDVHLGALARRLRLLGVDVAYRNDADDGELVVESLATERVLLTRDRGLLMRRALRWGAYVRGHRLDDQLVDVLDRFAPPLAPWTRCPMCNGALEPVDVAEVADRLEPGTLRTYTDFARCTGCGRPFWRGAHAAHLVPLVDAATARPWHADAGGLSSLPSAAK